jgi:MOSC domain-containing protein YiiM
MQAIAARIVSINVGRPRAVSWNGKSVLTSIWKEPVAGPVRVGAQNLAGDEQSDLAVHGGRDKAVYAYPSEHYAWWRRELPGLELPWGAFGENLTTGGLSEESVQIGDRLSVGGAEFEVTQPRMPCFKLGIRFGRSDMVRRFQKSGRHGFYLRVLREGEIRAGDAIALSPPEPPRMSVRDIAALYTAKAPEEELLLRAVSLPGLSDAWREEFKKKVECRR